MLFRVYFPFNAEFFRISFLEYFWSVFSMRSLIKWFAAPPAEVMPTADYVESS